MAQVTSKQPGRVIAENVAVTVTAAGNTVVLEVLTEDIDQIGVDVLATTQAFDAFLMEGRMSPDGLYQTVITSPWTVGGILIAASGNLSALAAATPGYALIDVRAFYSVRFSASKAVADSAATIRVFGKGHKVL